VELEPASATAHSGLAWILQHDLIGRRFAKGWDPDGSEAAYRKAKELDPNNATGRVSLAILLEHDTGGLRYRSKEKLNRAIEEYAAIKDKLKDEGAEYNLPTALVWAERFPEARETLKTLPTASLTIALNLVATAAAEGPDAALQLARKLTSNEATRNSALLSAAETLMQMRRYPAASELMKAGARGAKDPAAALSRAEMFRSWRPASELVFPETDPRFVVQQFVLKISSRSDKEELLQLFSPRMMGPADRKKLRVGLGRVPGLLPGVPPDVLTDIVASSMRMSVEGDDAGGYRIRTQAPGSPDRVFYVVRQEGRYGILGVSLDYHGIGAEVLALVGRGDLQTARHWLDWVREETSAAGNDDPWAGEVFTRFWIRGQQGDSDTIRHAAAVLLIDGQNPVEALPILQQGRAQAKADTERLHFDLALARAFIRLKKFEEVVAPARRLAEAAPRSKTAFALQAIAFENLERWQEAEQVARARLDLIPNDVEAIRALAQIAGHQRRYKDSIQILSSLIGVGKAEEQDYNNMAWDALMDGDVTPQAIEWAQRGVLLTQNQGGPVLHTLACLYAEMGKATEARDLLLKTLELWGLEEPNSEIWYGFGRIADYYGFPEAAIAAYQRVEAPEQKYALATATYTLAQRRLQALQQPKK